MAASQGVKIDLGAKKAAEGARFGGNSSASYRRLGEDVPLGYSQSELLLLCVRRWGS